MLMGLKPASSTTNLSPGKNSHRPDNPPLRQQKFHLERMLMGLTTHLFNNKYLT
jgi:hypothetical protein